MKRRKYRICENCGEPYVRRGNINWCKDCDTPYFIKRAIQIHGDRYDYKYTVYAKNNHKVQIICPEHGVFEQTPNNHLTGYGCHTCFGTKPHTNETFIKKAVKVHGDRYVYKDVNYTRNDQKVKIICPEHGVFKQSPDSHMQGNGCPVCGYEKRYTSEDFIKKAVEVHGDRYDYQFVEYINSGLKVKIVCPKHGIFEQAPLSHMQGNGCPSCSKTKPHTTETFIKKAVEVHGNRYGYQFVKYIKSGLKVKIVCRDHGIFEQIPSGHLSGKGCRLCARKSGKRNTN